MNEQKRLQLLLRHIQHVENNCKVMSESLIDNGEFDFARSLLRNAHIHDASKFDGMEWNHLTTPLDPLFKEAVRIHVTTNPHHPEYWDGIHNMPRVYIAELVSDWHARSSELCSKGLNQWIDEDGCSRFGFNKTDRVYEEIKYFVDLLLEPAFV